MADQTAWYRATPGQTLYAYPLSQAIADWATYAVTFTEKGDGGGWYSAVLDDAELDWAIFDTVPSSWDESEYASIHLEVGASGSAAGAPYYPTVTRNTDDDNPIFFSWESNVALTVQKSFNGGAFSATTGTATFSRAVGSLSLFELSYSADDRTDSGVIEYSITDGTDTYYLPLAINTGAGGGGGGGCGSGAYSVTIDCDDVSGAVQGVRMGIVGTSLENTTGTDGTASLNLDDGSYTLRITPPTGYNAVADIPITIAGSDITEVITLTEATPGSCEIPPL